VLGVPDEEWGNRLVAYVVGDVPLEDLRDWVAVEHPRTWAPRQAVVLPEMPLLGNGKTDRLALRRLLADPA
jgi:o-succinylbenzoate---CoA ligase